MSTIGSPAKCESMRIRLSRLKKKELEHLIMEVLPQSVINQIFNSMAKTIKDQEQHDERSGQISCFECRQIAKKLFI